MIKFDSLARSALLLSLLLALGACGQTGALMLPEADAAGATDDEPDEEEE